MKRAPLIFSLFLLVVPTVVSAEVVSVESLPLRGEHKDLTPTERIVRGSASGIKPHSEKYIKLSTRYDAKIADASLADRVLAVLREDPVLAERPIRLKVVSKNRTVRLEGVVNDEAEKALVAERAAAIEGVDKVENALRIKRSNKDLLED
jgi:hypothetical protein